MKRTSNRQCLDFGLYLVKELAFLLVLGIAVGNMEYVQAIFHEGLDVKRRQEIGGRGILPKCVQN